MKKTPSITNYTKAGQLMISFKNDILITFCGFSFQLIYFEELSFCGSAVFIDRLPSSLPHTWNYTIILIIRIAIELNKLPSNNMMYLTRIRI